MEMISYMKEGWRMAALPEPPERSTIAEVGFEPEPPTVGLRRGESRAPLKAGRYAPPGTAGCLISPARCTCRRCLRSA